MFSKQSLCSPFWNGRENDNSIFTVTVSHHLFSDYLTCDLLLLKCISPVFFVLSICCPNQCIFTYKTKWKNFHLHLPSHDQPRGLVTDFVDHSSISSTQLAYWFKIFIFQLPNLSFLGEEGFQAFALLFVQVQLT